MKTYLHSVLFSFKMAFVAAFVAVAFNPSFGQDPGDYVGDVNFTSQADIDNYVDEDQYTAIVGNVTISGDDITRFDKLKKIEMIFGNLHIVTNKSLTTLHGLDKLTRIWGDLIIDQNTVLDDISAFNHAMSNSGLIQITDNPVLGTCSVTMLCTLFGPAVSSRVMAPAISGNATGCNSPAEIRTSCGSLPVTLISFDAVLKEKSVVLKWATSSEINSRDFEVERSMTAKDWNKIGTVNAAGGKQGTMHYSFRDDAPMAGQNLYRLKMTDLDGTYAYSSINSITISKGAVLGAFVYPNPASDQLNIQVSKSLDIQSVQILNLIGQNLYRSAGQPNEQISVRELPTGSYTIRIAMKDGSVTRQKFVKK